MTKLLQINSSIFSDNGQSSQLANQFVAAWLGHHPDAEVTFRDLAQQPIAHLDLKLIQALSSPAEQRNPEQHALVAEADALIAEIQQANVIVIGVPMYNFAIPSTLKAYFDRIARAGVTFRYTENGPEGLLTGKKVYIFTTRGGVHLGTPLDTETTYVRHFLAFIGLTDVEFIYAEGLSKGDASKNTAIQQASQRLQALAI